MAGEVQRRGSPGRDQPTEVEKQGVGLKAGEETSLEDHTGDVHAGRATANEGQGRGSSRVVILQGGKVQDAVHTELGVNRDDRDVRDV